MNLLREKLSNSPHRSWSKKNHSQHNPLKGLRRCVSKKIVNTYAYCEKDSQTLKEENFKLKQQINLLKGQIIDQKSLIISLQRIVSTPQFKENLSVQKSININLQQQKQKLTQKVRLLEKELNTLKKDLKNVNVHEVQEEKNKLKHQVFRLRKMLINRIKSSPCDSPRENDHDRSLLQSLQTSKEIKSSHSIFKRGVKDSMIISKKGAQEGTKKLLQCLSKNQIRSSEAFKPSRVLFHQQQILPYNAEYSCSKKHYKSFISKQNKIQGTMKTFL